MLCVQERYCIMQEKNRWIFYGQSSKSHHMYMHAYTQDKQRTKNAKWISTGLKHIHWPEKACFLLLCWENYISYSPLVKAGRRNSHNVYRIHQQLQKGKLLSKYQMFIFTQFTSASLCWAWRSGEILSNFRTVEPVFGDCPTIKSDLAACGETVGLNAAGKFLKLQEALMMFGNQVSWISNILRHRVFYHLHAVLGEV